MPVSRNVFRFRVLLAHHGLDGLAHALAGVNQEQVLAVLNIVVERSQLIVFVGYTNQTAYPRPEQGRKRHDASVRNDGHIRAEELQRRKYHGTDQADGKAGEGAGESGSDDIQCFYVVAGMDTMFLQPGFIFADDVDIPILDPDGVQIV